MPEQRVIKRLVVLVDGSEQRQDKKQANESSVLRLKKLVYEGEVVSGGRTVSQTARYYASTANAPKLSDKLRFKTVTDDTADIIKTIVKDVLSTLKHHDDELWLYGSGHGAFIARAAAGVVHHMGLLKASFASEIDGVFEELYDATLSLIKAHIDDDFRHGPQLIQKIKGYTNGPPRIPFVGLFDSVILIPSKITYDTSFVPSIETLRHALAFNENRSSRALHILDLPSEFDLNRQSAVQAWFLGTNDDMCGGTENDGLSLYPLQWIVLESIYCGLSLVSKANSPDVASPLSLIFPQYAGNMPALDGTEDIQWRLQFTNGIRISMFDLQTTHASRAGGNNIHSIRLDPERYKGSPSRKIFEADEGHVRGWRDNAAYGNIIHPSLFCVLDRYPRYLSLSNFKATKHSISKFQDLCLVEENGLVAPWLQDLELQASGVKAFRILVCGKTGVGKSTLINKVFGVEMTEESKTYDQGVHDINVAFESPRHPGLLIHDSRGWQAGSDTELDLIAKFLRHRAFQEDPAEALHIIWFCVDSDVSRIEEADKRTFATIAQFSHQVPVFVVGTKKDKLLGYRKMQYLEEFMEKTNDYKEAKKLAETKANAVAEEQFAKLRSQLSQIEHYKADGFCCLSKDDDAGVKDLLSQTLDLIVDERVRLFCVAAQVVDVEQKINSAITECMRLGTHAIRTAAVPLPLSGMIGTPTVSRLICEHVLQCFGFPKAAPEEVEQIMRDIVMVHFKKFMTVSLTQFATVGAITLGAAIPTAGIGAVAGLAGCLIGLPPTARMLLKCSCDMILILERSFRYGGKFVSTKQIEDAARYYAKTTIKSFNGKEKLLQKQVHDEVDELVPLKKVSVGYKFNTLRHGVEEIIYDNRFGTPPDYSSLGSSSSLALARSSGEPPSELSAGPVGSELPGDTSPVIELPAPAEGAILQEKRTMASTAVEIQPESEVSKDETAVSPSRSEPTESSPIAPVASVSPVAPVAPVVPVAPVAPVAPVPETRTPVAELHVEHPELEGDAIAGEPREELEGSSVPVRPKPESRWGRISSSWKIRSKKSKSK